jgi:hypothetical protein
VFSAAKVTDCRHKYRKNVSTFFIDGEKVLKKCCLIKKENQNTE